MAAGPYANPAYNQAAIQQYASLWGVDPSQIVYTPGGPNGGFSVGGQGGNASSGFQPSYVGGQQATGGGVQPTPLNPIYYASPQTTQQVAGLVGGTPTTLSNTGQGASINIPSSNGIQLPNGQTVNAGVISNLLSRGYSPEAAAQQLAIQSGGQINITPQQIQQFMGAPSTSAAPNPSGNGWLTQTGAGGAAPGAAPAVPSPSGPGSQTTLGGGGTNPYAAPAPTGGASNPYLGGPGQTSPAFAPRATSPSGTPPNLSNYVPPPGTYGPGGIYNYSGAGGAGGFNAGGGIAIPGGAVPPGPNNQFPNWSGTTSATDPAAINNPIGNVSSTIGGVYGRALDYGNQFNNQFGAQYTGDIAAQNAYWGQSDAAYSDLYNTPGYTAQESASIVQQPLLTGGMTTPGQFQSNLLTPAEKTAIAADPSSALNYVGGAQSALNANLARTGQSFGTALANPNLTFSNQDVTNMGTLAAGTVGAQYGSMEDQLTRSALASGSANPLAVASAQAQFGRDEAAQQAEAAAGAQQNARLAQIQTNQSLAQQQIGAATTLGQLGQGAGEFIGQLGTGAQQYADTAASQRALAAAQNRQQTQQYNQSQAFGQGSQAAGQLGAANQNVANARIQGQQAARNYWQSQGQYYGSQGQSAAQDVLAGAQTSLGSMGQAANVAANTSLGRQSNIALPFGNFTL